MKAKINFRDGKVIYDDFNIDLTCPLEDQTYELQEDLLQVKYGNGYVLDLGWHPELDPKGYFVIHLIKNSNWDEPVYRSEVPFHDLVPELEKAVELVCSLNEKIRA